MIEGMGDEFFMDFLSELSGDKTAKAENINEPKVNNEFTITHLVKKPTNNGREFEVIGSPITKEEAEAYHPDSIIYQSANIIIATEQALEDAKNAIFLNDLGEPTYNWDDFTAGHKIYKVTTDQFLAFQKIHSCALAILKPEKTEKQTNENRTELDPVFDHSNGRNTLGPNSTVKRFIKQANHDKYAGITAITNTAINEFRKESERRKVLEKEEVEKAIQVSQKDKKISISKESTKKHEVESELAKENVGLAGTGLDKYVESLSELNKQTKENSAPNPDA